MRDRDIRVGLRRELERAHRQWAHDTRFIDELGLCQGNARIDIAVVNGSLSGYEIKSEKDTLQRLPHQVEIYSKALDHVTIVAGDLHVNKVASVIPAWWGIIGVFDDDGEVAFTIVRQPQPNPDVDAFSVAQLLWRAEVLEILTDLGLEKGVLGKPRRYLWQKLVQSQSLEDLKHRVRQTLKARERWRSDLLPALNDDSFLSVAT